MIIRSRGLNARVAEFGTSAVPSPSQYGGRMSHTGRHVRADDMFGLPAVMAAIRLVSETVASFDLCVYRGKGADRRLAEKTWQFKLLEQPNSEQDGFQWRFDAAAPVEGFGNSFFLKAKHRGRVEELTPIDPDFVQIRRDEHQQKVFDVGRERGKPPLRLTPADVLHIRGPNPRGGLSGLSPVALHRHSLGFSLALEEWSGRFFQNDATPPVAIKVPGPLNREQAKEMADIWADQRGGLGNAHKPAFLYNNASLERIGVSMLDAAFVDASQHSIEEVARMFRVPADLLEAGMRKAGVASTPEQQGLRFLMFSILARVRRIEAALKADTDLFGSGDLYPEFDTSELLRADAATQASADKAHVQAGIFVPDEVRARLGYPPLPNGIGTIPQITPVGGAPNPAQEPPTLDAEAEYAQENLPRVIVIPVPIPSDSSESRTADILRETTRLVQRTLADQQMPDVIVNVSPTPIENHNHLPELPPATVQVDNHVETPTVNVENRVEAPLVEVAAPHVTVENRVPEQAAPTVNVNVPEPKPRTKTIKPKRGHGGRIDEIEVTED